MNVLRQFSRAAKAEGLPFDYIRKQGGHDIYSLDGVRLAFPHHRDIRSGTADSLRRRAEEKLGKRWSK